MQARLLTTLEKRQITRLGSTQARPIDIRLICATNADIHQMITEGTFRQDLLYRINTIEIPIPPLRERGRDILLLADHFLKIYSYKYKKEINGLNRETQQKLLNPAMYANYNMQLSGLSFWQQAGNCNRRILCSALTGIIPKQIPAR